MTNADMGNMPDHYPARGDQVEAWIKDRRDQYHSIRQNPEFIALDNLLEEYRLASDTMQSLYNIVNPEDPEFELTRQPKPKKEPRTR